MSLIVPPESVTFFASSFSNHSLLKAQPKLVFTADVFSIKSSEIVFVPVLSQCWGVTGNRNCVTETSDKIWAVSSCAV